MKGKTPTMAEKDYHNQIAALGCIACRLDGVDNRYVSVHHCAGRTKAGAHMQVIGLCAGHHQDGTGAPGLIAVHPWKRRFEARYGSQVSLIAMCRELIGVAA